MLSLIVGRIVNGACGERDIGYSARNVCVGSIRAVLSAAELEHRPRSRQSTQPKRRTAHTNRTNGRRRNGDTDTRRGDRHNRMPFEGFALGVRSVPY